MKRSVSLFLFFAIVLTCAVAIDAADAKNPNWKNITIMGGSVGGNATISATVLSECIKAEYPDAVIDVPPGGTISNILAIGTGQCEFGFATTTTVKEAYTGDDSTTPQFATPLTDVMSIGLTWNQEYQFVVPKDFPAESIDEIFEKKMAVRLTGGAKGNIGGVITEQLLGTVFGLTVDDVNNWGGRILYIDYSEAIAMMQDGHLDVFCPGTASPMATLLELFSVQEMKCLPISDKANQMMAERFGYLPGVIKAGTYSGIEKDIPAIIAPYSIIVNKNVSEDTVYEFTRILCENKEKLASAHVAMEQFFPETCMNGLGSPLHPGAEKYFRERGWIK